MRGIKILNVLGMDHHRNGVCGDPFKVAVYMAEVDGVKRKMVTVRFRENDGETLSKTTTCTFDVDCLVQGDVAFAEGNSWRGDHFAIATEDIFKEDEA